MMRASARTPMIVAALVAAIFLLFASFFAPILGVTPFIALAWFALRYEFKDTIQCCALFLCVAVFLSGPVGAFIIAWMLCVPALIFSKWQEGAIKDLSRLHLTICQWGWATMLGIFGLFWNHSNTTGQDFTSLIKEQTGITIDRLALPESLSKELGESELQSMMELAMQLLPGISVGIWCLLLFLISLILLRTSETKNIYVWKDPDKSNIWLLYIVALTIIASSFGSEMIQPLALGSFIILLYAYTVFFIVPLHFRLANQPVKWVVLSACYGSMVLLVWPVMVMACWALGNHAAFLLNSPSPKK